MSDRKKKSIKTVFGDKNKEKVELKEKGKTDELAAVEPDQVKQAKWDKDTDKKLASLEAEINKESKKQKTQPITVKNENKPDDPPGSPNSAAFFVILALTLIIVKIPALSFIFMPLNQFSTFIHEFSHAIATILTGGHVSGMTIVPDGAGHGGLTFSQGGLRFLIIQAGYMGTTIFGCLLVYLSKFPKLSKAVLIGLSAITLLSTLFFIGPGILSATFFQSLMSFVVGLILAGAMYYAGTKLKYAQAHWLLLFLAINMAMDSINSIWIVVGSALNPLAPYSDATSMQKEFFLPAILWSLIWAGSSLAMLSFTIWKTHAFSIKPAKTADKH